MIQRQGAIYHYRRKVPPALRAVVKQTEIWATLRTPSRTTARARAGLLYAVTEQIFEAARMDDQAEVERLQLRLAALRAVTGEIQAWDALGAHAEEATRDLRDIQTGIEQLAGRLAEARQPDPTVQAALTALAQATAAIAARSPAKDTPTPTGPLFSASTEEFLTSKSEYLAANQAPNSSNVPVVDGIAWRSPR